MQTKEQSPDKDKLCMSTTVPYYPPGMYQRLDSVCERAPLFGIPSHTTSEIQQLRQKVQVLEEDLKTANQRHKRELLHMQMEQQYERSEHEGKVRLLDRQLQETHLNGKYWESVVVKLMEQLRQKESHSSTAIRGQDYADSEFEVSFTSARSTSTTSSSCVCSRADSGERHETYTVQSFSEHHEEVTQTVVCLRGCPASKTQLEGEERVDDCLKGHIIRSQLYQLQELLENKHIEMERQLTERMRSELGTRHLHFLQVNNRLTEIVSQSLECLSACGNSDSVAGVGEDLRWLQENLEKCKLGRHASWP